MVPGDVVLAVDGKSLQEPQQLAALLFRKKVGETLRFSIQRVDKSKAELSVTIARRPRDPENMFDPAHLADDLVPRLGIVAIPLSSEVAKLLPLTRKQSGLVVVALTAGGKAALLDFQVGDVLYSINRTPITTVSELRKTLEGLPEDGSVAIQLERDGKLQFVSFPNPD
jgi:serine protease DegQ